jgi:hypothetical protein
MERDDKHDAWVDVLARYVNGAYNADATAVRPRTSMEQVLPVRTRPTRALSRDDVGPPMLAMLVVASAAPAPSKPSLMHMHCLPADEPRARHARAVRPGQRGGEAEDLRPATPTASDWREEAKRRSFWGFGVAATRAST